MKLQTILRRFSVEQIQKAIRYSRVQGRRDKLESEAESLRTQLARVERKLAALNGNRSPAPLRKRGRKPGFKVSASTRRKMAEAAKRRHAKTKPKEPKPRRKWRMSAEGRQRIADAARRRWAAARTAKEALKAEVSV